jgi:hypothetical protein
MWPFSTDTILWKARVLLLTRLTKYLNSYKCMIDALITHRTFLLYIGESINTERYRLIIFIAYWFSATPSMHHPYSARHSDSSYIGGRSSGTPGASTMPGRMNICLSNLVRIDSICVISMQGHSSLLYHVDKDCHSISSGLSHLPKSE